MAFTCKDCSYSGAKGSGLGTCPACGSGNFGRNGGAAKVEESRGSSPARLAMMAALWLWLIFEIYRKLNAA